MDIAGHRNRSRANALAGSPQLALRIAGQRPGNRASLGFLRAGRATLSKTGGEDPRLEVCQLINPDANEQRLGSNALSHGPACCSRRTPVITGTVEAQTTLAAADAIPESTSMALLGTGLFSLALLHRRRLKHEA